MSKQLYQVGQSVLVRGQKPPVVGTITQARLQGNGWVYELKLLDNPKSRPTYLESQVVAAGGTR